jgi:hypothetical protein
MNGQLCYLPCDRMSDLSSQNSAAAQLLHDYYIDMVIPTMKPLFSS